MGLVTLLLLPALAGTLSPPDKNWRILLEQSFNACMSLLMAHWSSNNKYLLCVWPVPEKMLSYFTGFIMAALWNRAGHYTFALWFLLLLSSFFSSPVLSRHSLDVRIWCGLSANLGCRSETCCTRLAENTGCKNSSSGHHCTTLSGYIFAMKAHSDNRKKTC